MVPLVFQFNHFRGKMHFLNFSQKTSVAKIKRLRIFHGLQYTFALVKMICSPTNNVLDTRLFVFVGLQLFQPPKPWGG
jgi:hypothetical protein